MHSGPVRAFAMAAVFVGALAAGCFEGAQEGIACPRQYYVSIQYGEGLDPEWLEPAFVARGWEWSITHDEWVDLEPPQNERPYVRGRIAAGPGVDALGTVISFETRADERGETPGDAARVQRVAQSASSIVNETFEPDPPIERWITGERVLQC